MLVIGHLLSQSITNNIPAINISRSSSLADKQYSMLHWSELFTYTSQWWVVVLVIGGFVTVLDMMKRLLEISISG